jgi:hypothetical protein
LKILNNELSYEEANNLRDIYYACTVLGERASLPKFNHDLKVIISNLDEYLKEYPEYQATMDPFKEKLINGIALNLGDIGVDTVDNAKNLKFRSYTETNKHKAHLYPYKPDLIFGNYRDKIALWLTNQNIYEYHDSYDTTTIPIDGTPLNGRQRLHAKILEKLHKTDRLQCAYLPLEALVDYDLENLEVKLKDNSLQDMKFLSTSSKPVFTNDLIKLATWFISDNHKATSEKLLSK